MSKNQEIKVVDRELTFKLALQKLESLQEIQNVKGLLRFIAGELVLLNQKVGNL